MTTRKQWVLPVLTAASLAMAACSDDPVVTRPRAYVGFPETIDARCRDGKATMFDECGDQSALFAAALARANAEGKVLLVEFGSEWCIWCHVFEAHINGEHDRFRYTYGAADEPETRYTTTFREGEVADVTAANALRDFVATSFVIVHIDAEYAPNGSAVLEASGAGAHFPGGIPFVFTVDQGGQFAARFEHDAVEKRRDTQSDWYRGYDRAGLLLQLKSMRDAARGDTRRDDATQGRFDSFEISARPRP